MKRNSLLLLLLLTTSLIFTSIKANELNDKLKREIDAEEHANKRKHTPMEDEDDVNNTASQKDITVEVFEKYMSDENKLWTKEEGYKPFLEFLVGISPEEFKESLKEHKHHLTSGDTGHEDDHALLHEAYVTRKYLHLMFEGKETMTNEEFKALFNYDVYTDWAETLSDEENEEIEKFVSDHNNMDHFETDL